MSDPCSSHMLSSSARSFNAAVMSISGKSNRKNDDYLAYRHEKCLPGPVPFKTEKLSQFGNTSAARRSAQPSGSFSISINFSRFTSTASNGRRPNSLLTTSSSSSSVEGSSDMSTTEQYFDHEYVEHLNVVKMLLILLSILLWLMHKSVDCWLTAGDTFVASCMDLGDDIDLSTSSLSVDT